MRPPRPRASGNAVAGLLSLLAVVAVLTGCGKPVAPASGGTFTPGTPDVLTVATTEVPEPGFWLGTAAHPAGGFEAELARALARRLGLARVRVVEVPFARILAGDLGGADLALADVTVTDERARHVTFSIPYLPAPPAVLVRRGTDVPDVHAARDLRWAVQRGTTLHDALLDTVPLRHAPTVTATEAQAVATLTSGRAQAVLLDLPVALAYVRGDDRLAVAAQLPSDGHLAAVLPLGADNVVAVDSALRALRSDGTIAGLAARWLGTNLENGRADDVPAWRTGSL